jgi:hypothetical protein
VNASAAISAIDRTRRRNMEQDKIHYNKSHWRNSTAMCWDKTRQRETRSAGRATSRAALLVA